MSLPLPPPEDESHYPRPYGEVEKAEAEERPSPPLSIQHLFLWTTCLAIVAGIGMATTPREFLATFEPGMMVQFLVTIALHGTLLAAATLWVGRRLLFRIPFPTQPGHWSLLGWFLLSLYAYVPVYAPFFPWPLVGFLLQLAAAAVFFLAARDTAAWRAWQVYFGALCGMACARAVVFLGSVVLYAMPPPRDLYHGVAFLLMGGSLLSMAAVAVAVVAWMVAVLMDRAYGTRRDWQHYVGVATAALMVIGHFAAQVLWSMH